MAHEEERLEMKHRQGVLREIDAIKRREFAPTAEGEPYYPEDMMVPVPGAPYHNSKNVYKDQYKLCGYY
jgi:hypothetical protein